MTSVHPPFDIRVFYKMCKSLADARYDVVLIAMIPETAVKEGVRIVPFPMYKNRVKRLLFSPFKMFSMALKEKAAVYHFHDPELLVTAFLLKLSGKKVIYDVHEDYSREINDKYWIKSRFVRKAVSLVYRFIEWTLARFFITRVIAVTTDIAAKFPRKKTVMVRNFVDVEMINAAPAKSEKESEKKEKPVIIHVGGLSPAKGIREAVQAVGLLAGRAELRLLGKWGEPGYEEECKSLDGWKYTSYIGSLEPREVYSYLKTADIGLSTQYPVGNFLTALPLKFFEYMACSLPMVISDFPFWREMFGQCSLFADPFKPEQIAERLRYLLDNRQKARELGRQGYRLVAEKYNWNREQKELLALYERLLTKKKKEV
jgi:glycosyltransferase involved in cell wall biosynthesis